MKAQPLCPVCGSQKIMRDAIAHWCEEAKDWEMLAECADCGAVLREVEDEPEQVDW